jgi:exo-beta-1,3-glucanase (GH17 family)
MKLSILSTTTLALTAAAVPHRRHQQHHHRRDVVVDVVTDVVTQTAPVAVVYVNQDGAPQWTSYHRGGGRPHWPTQAPPAPTSTSSDVASAIPTSAPAESAPPPSYGSSEAPASSETPAPSSPAGGSTGSFGYGLSYAPYDSSGGCKTEQAISSDFEAFSDYGMVRIYGTDCEQVPSVIKAAKAKGMKVFAGIYDISQVESEAQTLIDAAKNDWDMIDTVSVGNEVVNNGGSVSDVVNAINTARSMLKSAGYNGKVVTVDTFSAIIDNPELCQASDFAAANCHAFFNADTTAGNAGQYVADQAAQVKKACGGMDTMITESGWPSKGDSNGAAVPSEANQKAAISSLRAAFSDNIVLFSAFDDLWKTNTAATFNAEQYWGIYGMAPSE